MVGARGSPKARGGGWHASVAGIKAHCGIAPAW